ncbi:MAG TPA: hypothetical protein VF178_17310 [Gemmatimonadaceae bacterium]
MPATVLPAQQEFTQQTLLVAPLHAEGSNGVARAVAARLRSRLNRLAVRRELFVVGTDTIEILAENSGFRYDVVFGETQTLALARWMRADEVILGTVVDRPGDSVEVRVQMALMRDWRLRQPLPVVRAGHPNAAADTLAQMIIQARGQMTGLRRCENAARAARTAEAARHAEEAIRNYPRSALARTCLLIALPFNNVGPDSIARLASDILAIDSLNIVAAVVRAQALTSLQRATPAAEAWQRVLSLRADSVAIAQLAVEQLLRLQRPELALAGAQRLAAQHPEEPYFSRLAFLAHIALASWRDAATLGDSLDVADAYFRDDSTFAIRHIEALRATGDTLGALAKSARVVKQHRTAVGLYLQYLQILNGEQQAALARGLALFPHSSELNVMAARSALTSGKKREAIAALAAAVAADSTLTQGYLQMAELWFEEGYPDSALAAIARAPRSADAGLLRAYAIARGRQLIRVASDSTPDAWQRGVALFALADTLDSQADSRALLTAATLQLARSELVLATQHRTCPEAQRADRALQQTAAAIGRGIGDGSAATELQEAYDAMRAAVENAVQVLCAGTGSDTARNRPPPASR